MGKLCTIQRVEQGGDKENYCSRDRASIFNRFKHGRQALARWEVYQAVIIGDKTPEGLAGGRHDNGRRVAFSKSGIGVPSWTLCASIMLLVSFACDMGATLTETSRVGLPLSVSSRCLIPPSHAKRYYNAPKMKTIKIENNVSSNNDENQYAVSPACPEPCIIRPCSGSALLVRCISDQPSALSSYIEGRATTIQCAFSGKTDSDDGSPRYCTLKPQEPIMSNELTVKPYQGKKILPTKLPATTLSASTANCTPTVALNARGMLTKTQLGREAAGEEEIGSFSGLVDPKRKIVEHCRTRRCQTRFHK